MGVTIHYTLRFEGDEEAYSTFVEKIKSDLLSREEFSDARMDMNPKICEFYQSINDGKTVYTVYSSSSDSEEETVEHHTMPGWDFPVFSPALCITFPGCETFVVAPGRYFCKTQFGKHFVRMHTALLSVLEYCEKTGWSVEVEDETGYWEHRDVEKLKEKQKFLSGMIDRMAGKLDEMPPPLSKEEENKMRQEWEKQLDTLQSVLNEFGIRDIDPRKDEEKALEALTLAAPRLADRFWRIRMARERQNWSLLEQLSKDVEQAAGEIMDDLKKEKDDAPDADPEPEFPTYPI